MKPTIAPCCLELTTKGEGFFEKCKIKPLSNRVIEQQMSMTSFENKTIYFLSTLKFNLYYSLSKFLLSFDSNFSFSSKTSALLSSVVSSDLVSVVINSSNNIPVAPVSCGFVSLRFWGFPPKKGSDFSWRNVVLVFILEERNRVQKPSNRATFVVGPRWSFESLVSLSNFVLLQILILMICINVDL